MSKIVATKRSNKGFTLIELLVVVVIIGVLAAVALPNLIGQTDKARTTEATAVLSAINTGQEAQFQENSAYVALGTVGNPVFVPSGASIAQAKGLSNTQIVTTGMGVNDASTILGVNIAGANWAYATSQSGAASAATWNAGARGTAAPFTNLQAYVQKGTARALIDSDNAS